MASAKLLLLCMAITCAAAGMAQEVAKKTATNNEVSKDVAKSLEEITVVARKRDETLLEVPLSITAITADQIAKAQIRDIFDVSHAAPGFNFKSNSFASGGRWSAQPRFRGMDPVSASPTNQVGAIFVDGLSVLGTAQASLSTADVEQIEVLKGPQNAYFGRNTFGGAVNFRTRDPGQAYRGSVEGSFEERDSYFGSFAFEGGVPKVDSLAFRVSASYRHKGGQYPSGTGGRLGEEQTSAGAFTLTFKPTESFSARLRYAVTADDDGAPAIIYLIPGVNVSGANQCRVPGASVDYFCGAVPRLNQLNVTDVLNNNTSLASPALAARGVPTLLNSILSNTPLTVAGPAGPITYVTGNNSLMADSPHLTHFGLRRDSRRFALSGNYKFGAGYELSAKFGANNSEGVRLWDQDERRAEIQYGIENGIFKDRTYEASLRSPELFNNHFSWFLGYNHYKQQSEGFTGGGNRVTITTSAVLTPANVIYSDQTVRLRENGEVSGVFGSVTYRFNEQWKVDLEGRSQKDDVTTGVGTTAQRTDSFKDFMPRFIVTWEPTHALTFYGSYSKGVLPGTNNALVSLYNATSQAALKAAFPQFGLVVDSEQLRNYEVGVKQRVGNWFYALSAYSMKWSNLKDGVFTLCAAPGFASGSPAACGLPPGVPSSGFVTAVVPQSARIKGLEFEINGRITDRWSAGGTAAYVDGTYDQFVNSALVSFAATQFAGGKNIFQYPTTSFSLNSTYEMPVMHGDWSGFIRGDLYYTGKQYADQTNVAYANSYSTLNAHFGIKKDKMSFELYCNNLLDNKEWATAQRVSDLGITNKVGIVVVPPDKRVAGIHFSMGLQ